MDLPGGVSTFEGKSKIDLWLIEDPDDPNPTSTTFPAKVIRVPQGSVVHADVDFKLKTHTIHWHGIEPTPMNDGVGHTSFEVTSHWIYQFQPNTAGTYFYHCHKNTVLHFEMGLYGLLIIDPPQGPNFAAANAPSIRGFNPATFTVPIDVEAAWVPDEFDSHWHVLNHDAFMQACDANNPAGAGTFTHDGILNDFQPDIFLITGVVSVPDPTQPLPPGVSQVPPFGIGAPIIDPAVAVTARVGDNILIRLVNAGYTIQEYTLGIDAKVIAQDGHPLGVPPVDQYSYPFVIPANTAFRLTTAMRQDLMVTPTATGTFPFRVKYLDLNNGQLYHVAQTTITVT
jgi:FtsP/CotA-like multicopper oxidase with cupredoxin domain